MTRIKNLLVAASLSVFGLGVFAALDATLNPADAVIIEFDDGSAIGILIKFDDGSAVL